MPIFPRSAAAIIALVLPFTAACLAHPQALPSTTTPTPTPILPPRDRTNLDAIVSHEVAVYPQPIPGQTYPTTTANTPEPQRIWTLPAGTQVTVICEVAFPENTAGGSGLYISWAPDKQGYIADDIVITSRTPDTNEQISTLQIKFC